MQRLLSCALIRLLTAFASTFPKGTAFGNAVKLPAPTKAVPVGQVA